MCSIDPSKLEWRKTPWGLAAYANGHHFSLMRYKFPVSGWVARMDSAGESSPAVAHRSVKDAKAAIARLVQKLNALPRRCN